jgi:NDP-sugar pyrophosphorylase family protein
MILAAGLGTRLDPLTRFLPKALVPVLNKPMLYWWLRKLRSYGIINVVVNAHHLADLLTLELNKLRLTFPDMTITLSLEETILGTGGGVKKGATNFIGPFFVVNGDIWTDIDLSLMARRHLANKAAVTLAVLDRPAYATVSVANGNRIIGLRLPQDNRPPQEAARLCGLGVMVVNNEILDCLPIGFSDIIAEIAKILDQHKILAYPSLTSFWSDMGSLSAYYELNRYLARNRVIGLNLAEVNGQIEGFAVLGQGAVIEKGAKVIDSILWPKARVEEGAVIQKAIVVGQVAAQSKAQDVYFN